ncbi:MAG: CCA tRNA nucleotidyltransferase [Eubacteriales bacterium]|nr:CCA tRNA nucleotidyltransferase [Eubacteriales bacterium]MDD3881951.1 CCA tRNA nucleotidyltransferase [Eubacteriales bacterium]MDD4513148.1 CCA tRNA nucleotidyltransferase [Eubacteriales bacterium]
MGYIYGLPDSAAEIMLRLESAGYEAYCVGGCVRDKLLGKEPADWDICTSAAPDETLGVFSEYRTIPTGLKHGTVTVLCKGEPFEITTYRIDGDYTDGRHPDSVSFTRSLRDDLMRRDFTVNAMAADARGCVRDYYGGEIDLAKKILRAVGNAEKRFSEDALRILRAVRFSAVLGFEIEESTANAARALKSTLDKVSRERIYTEIRKLLCGEYAAETLASFSDIIAAAIPQLESESIKNAAALIGELPRELCVRLAALLRGLTEEKADAALRELKAPNDIRKTALKLIESSKRPIPEERSTLKRKLDELLPVWNEAAAINEALFGKSRTESANALKDSILSRKECYTLKALDINGSELCGRCGIKGKQTGEILSRLLDAVIDGRLPNEKEKLLDAAKAML